MNFVIAQTDLSKGLKVVSHAVASGRCSHPILTHVLLEANASGLMLTAFDLSLSISTEIAATVETQGRTCVPARVLSDLIARLNSDDAVSISADDSHSIQIVTAGGTYRLAGDDPDGYPALPVIEPGTLELSAEDLKAAIEATIVAASKDESKQILQGVFLQTDDDTLELAATDGHRLSVYGSIQGGDAPGHAIPATAIREVLGLDSETVRVGFHGGHVAFGGGSTTIRSRVFEGKYPNYRQLIPKSFTVVIRLDRKLFIQALERVAIIAEQFNNIIRLNYDDGIGVVTISSEHETGFGSEQLLPKASSGKALVIAANVRYITEAARSIHSADIEIWANTAAAPFLLRPVGDDQPDQLALIMPVQVRT